MSFTDDFFKEIEKKKKKKKSEDIAPVKQTSSNNYTSQFVSELKEREDELDNKALTEMRNSYNFATNRASIWDEYTEEEDFSKLSVATGSKRKDVGWRFWEDGGDDKYDFINNINEYRNQVGAMSVGSGQKEEYGDYTKYTFMDEKQISIYNYLYAKYGKSKAEEYLKDIEETLNEDYGTDLYNNQTAVGKAMSWLPSGMANWTEDVKQFFSSEELPTSPYRYQQQLIQEEAEEISPVLGILNKAGMTASYQIPSIILAKGASELALAFGAGAGVAGTIGKIGGALGTGVSSAGSAYKDALSDGYSEDDARTYSTVVGALESGLTYAIGGFEGMTGVGTDKALRAVSTIESSLLRNIAKHGIRIAGEIGEEELQLWLEPLVRSAVFNEEYDAPTIDEMVETALVTAISTGVMNAASDVGDGGRINGLSVNEAKVVDKVYKEAIAEKEADGKKLTAKEKNKLYDDVVEQMKKGYIGTDTIESVLGGKTYEGYKNLTEQESSLNSKKKAIEEEIKSLIDTPESQFTVEQRERLTSLRNEAKSIEEQIKALDTKSAKSNLFNEVNKLTKSDTYLQESYNEIARKGQAFEADLTKYTGKQKEAVERAINSGVLNNTNRSHELVDVLSKIEADKGITFDYTNNEKLKKSGFAVEGVTVDGFEQGGNVTLNVQSSKAWQSTVGHEITHVLEGTESYGALREALYAYAKSKGELASKKAKLTELYKRVGDADIDSELTADLVGEYLFNDKNFIDKLTGNRTLFQKVWDEIKYLCKVATGKELTEIEKVERAFDKAWKEHGRTAEADDSDFAGEADVAFSISVTDKATLDHLNEQVTKGEYNAETNPDGGYYVTYKSMSFWGYDEDGNAILRSPMAEYVDGELSNAYLVPKDKSKLNWYQSTETIDENTGLPTGLLVKAKKDGNKSFSYLPAAENQDLIKEDWSNLYFNLQKKVLKNGKWVNSDVPARYNPYEHSSNSMLNDQFSAAYLRDNLVTVKMYVPVSEDNGTFRAKYSKDATGWSDWKTGTVAGKINQQKDLQRRVYLSRYAAPVEIVPDSEVAQAYKEYLDGTDVTIPDNVVSPNLLNELKKAGVPITESGKVKYSITEDIDKDGDLGYNGNDLYTATDEFYHDVDRNDRGTFPRSLANKTAGMEKDETRTVEIYGANKVYFFEATGYMQGQMLYSANIKDVDEYRTVKKEFYNGDNSSKQTFSSWSSVLSLDGTGTRSDIHSIDNGRTESDVYEVYGESRTSNGTGTQERIGESFENDPEEVKHIIAELREMYGLAENHPTNEIAPIKEVSSTDDAFFDGENTNTRFSLSEDSDADYMSAVAKGDAATAQKIVENTAESLGYTIRAYHGTARGDRVGNVFLPERATSGPMAFFTSDKQIAENYSKSKQDTSMAYDPDYDRYETQFRIKRGEQDLPLYRAWNYLSYSAKQRITEKASQLREDWDGDYDLILDPETNEANGGFQWQLKEARGNAIQALTEQWLNSGTLFNEEGRFLDVLKMAGVNEEFEKIGMNNLYFKDPAAKHEKVYDTFLKLTNPFDTANVNEEFIADLEEWYDAQDQSKYDVESSHADLWDKNNRDAYDFADILRDDLAKNTTHAWTSIPDAVTDYLKSKGYDGIKDTGGKYSGESHIVYIPFYSEQIKSADAITYDDNGNVIPLSERFNTTNKDIRYSLSDEGEQFAPTGNYSTPANETALEDIAPVKEEATASNEDVIADDAPVTTEEILDDLAEEKASLADKYAKRKAKLQKLVEDKPTYFSNKALALYNEVRNMRKGVKVSKELGYLLDNLSLDEANKSASYNSLRTALINIKNFPNKTVNSDSAIESIAREMLNASYENDVYDLSDMDNQYQQEVARLEEATPIDKKIFAKLKNLRSELDNNKKLRDESNADFDSEIARLQAEYDAKKDKNTKVANNLLRRIERMQRLKANVNADYEARISSLSERVNKVNTPQYKRGEQRRAKQDQYSSEITKMIGDTSTWRDKKLGIAYQTNTLHRNLRDVVRDANGNQDIAKADEIYEYLQGSYNRNEAQLKRESQSIKQKYADMKINKHESEYIQMLGEFKYNPETKLTLEAVDEYFEKHKKHIDIDKVNKAIEESRKDYDSLIKRVNAVLREQGMKEIAYKQGYFPHFTETKQSWLGKLFNWKTIDNDIPTDIAGLTEEFEPVRTYQSFDKRRKSDETDYNFLKGFDTYVHGALDWIYHIEDIQKRRAFENEIRYSHSEQGIRDKVAEIKNNKDLDTDEVQALLDNVYKEAKNPLNNFVTDLRNSTNNLAGKKSTTDRTMEYATNRKVYSTMTNISNRVTGNMVVGSISSALTNFIPITQSWGQVSPVSSLKAVGDVVRNAFRKDGMIEKSTFMTNRLMNEENLNQTGWDKASKVAGGLMDVVDHFTTEVIWRSKYIENMNNGMSENEAISNADVFAENVMAGRSRGNMPTIYNSKNPMTKMLTAFQLEVANQYGYMFKDLPQDVGKENMGKLAAGYAKMFIGAYVYNALYSSLTGRDAAFDPIGILEDLMKDLGFGGDDEEEEVDILGAVKGLGENIMQEVPYVGGLLGGGRIPVSSAMPYDSVTEMVTGTTDDIANKDWENLTNEWLNPVYYLALPFGGGQIRKTMQGLDMFSDEHPVSGSYTTSGNLRFPVEDTPLNKVQAALFGQYASENAREYFDNGYAPLKEKQIQEYIDVDMPIKDYWEYREGLNDLAPLPGSTSVTLEQKLDYIDSLDLPTYKKNILVNNVTNRKEPIDMTSYGDYGSLEEFDFATKSPDKYALAKSVGGYDSYKTYAEELYDIKADKDENGKSISGSRKEKVLQYINNLDADYETKIILYKSEYPSDDTYNMEIINYLNNREDLTYEERVAILTELGFTVSNGTVYWD